MDVVCGQFVWAVRGAIAAGFDLLELHVRARLPAFELPLAARERAQG